MVKADEYRRILRSLSEWDEYLMEKSGLPGPRGNIELAEVVAEEGNPSLFKRYIAISPTEAPVNSAGEFLVFSGILGLGRLLAEGDHSQLLVLRDFAKDPRWRVREAVAMALQNLGDVDMALLITEMEQWSKRSLLEKRAAAAALCEPRLLKKPEHNLVVLNILDEITSSIEQIDSRRSTDFLVLRKGLAYCWSVATASQPEEGKKMIEKWLGRADQDIRWIMKQNLNKARLARMDAEWVAKCQNLI